MKDLERYEFDTFKELEEYFIDKVLVRQGISSKVIGKTLLVWKKDKKNGNL